MSEPERPRFDPFGLMHALDRHRVTYIVIGAVARVIHGSGELTEGLDIVPSLREENLRRLGFALDDVNASGRDGRVDDLQQGLGAGHVLELETDSGRLSIVPEPAGTRGYEDLRRAARREHLGRGLRPSIASTGDLARMLAALDREQDRVPLRRLRRLIELEHGLERSRGIER